MRTALGAVLALLIALSVGIGVHQYQARQAAQDAAAAARITSLEDRLAGTQQFLDENTQSPNWNSPMSLADERRLGPAGNQMAHDVLAGPGVMPR